MTFHIWVFSRDSKGLLNTLEHFILPRVFDREAILSLPESFVLVSELREVVRCHISSLEVNLICSIDSFLNSLGHISWLITHNRAIFYDMIALSKEIFPWHLIFSIELVLKDSLLVDLFHSC
jgi:hypothetical protein